MKRQTADLAATVQIVKKGQASPTTPQETIQQTETAQTPAAATEDAAAQPPEKQATPSAATQSRAGQAAKRAARQRASHQPPARRPQPPVAAIKAMSLKVDHDRYLALKKAGLLLGRTSQDILIEAIDLWLERYEDALDSE